MYNKYRTPFILAILEARITRLIFTFRKLLNRLKIILEKALEKRKRKSEKAFLKLDHTLGTSKLIDF